MANLFEQVNVDSLELAGRNPDWLMQQDSAFPNGLPSANSGVSLGDSLRTQVRVSARESVRFRTVYIAIRVLDLVATYRATVNAFNVDFDALVAASTARADVIPG